MKKLILVCVSFLAAVPAFGQGQVDFANNRSTLLTTNNGSVSGPITGFQQWLIGLYIAPDDTTDSSQFRLIAIATNSNTTAGRFRAVPSPTTIDGNFGQPIAYQIKAWMASAGNSYETAVGGYRGQSIIGRVFPSTAAAPTPNLFALDGAPDFSGQLTTGFELTIVPEPSSLALGLLGLGASALVRRRK